MLGGVHKKVIVSTLREIRGLKPMVDDGSIDEVNSTFATRYWMEEADQVFSDTIRNTCRSKYDTKARRIRRAR